MALSKHLATLEVIKRPGESVRGRNVLLIDGVLDRGATLSRAQVTAAGSGRGRHHFRGCSGEIGSRSRVSWRTMRCSRAGSEFLYGYGMDWAGHDRGLPDIESTTNRHESTAIS